ncbi:MAG TPA: SecD/SecF family protein translocase subunit, partial [Candidatus Absconditabacterales bacterium]|nr:SecD/SecF family protein translocase subunit [Candidatus Absconditabacterales bacterium]
MEGEQLSNGIYYNQKTKTILFDLGDPFSGQIAYQVDVYAPSTTGSIASGESVSFDEDVVKKGFLPLVDKKRASSAQLPLLDQLGELTPKTAKIYTTGGQTLIVKIYDKKELSQSLYRSILLTNVTTKELASSFIADLLANDTYNMEVIFVRDQNMWIAAKDSQNRVLNGAYFKFASVSRDQVGRPAVQVDLDDTGKDIFCNITQSNIQKQMAIFVGGVLATAPTIQDKICGGSAIINGSFDLAGAKELADSLNEGALPAKLIQVNESKVSATLGENAWKGALRATLLSFILIFLLMARRYGTKKAFISIIALVSFIIVLIAILKLVGYALSLSGMAAIILNIGMGVDAAILIYERLREEQDKGRSGEHAVYEAYERARPAIFGGQMSTLAIGVLLVLLGSDLFQGFGVVMTLNIVILLIISV